MLRVKKEVRQLCAKMTNAEIESKDELIRKWKFTPFNLHSQVEVHTI